MHHTIYVDNIIIACDNLAYICARSEDDVLLKL